MSGRAQYEVARSDGTDMLTPAQYYGAIGNSRVDGNRRLAVAILEGVDVEIGMAERHGAGYQGRILEELFDLVEWMLGATHPNLLDFETVCYAAQLDPSAVRTVFLARFAASPFLRTILVEFERGCGS